MHIIWKQLGETPLEALERTRIEVRIASDVPMTYAGRLDPAAEGLLVILTGEECKKKEDYTNLPKTYMAEILVGVSTDSYDLLGIPTYVGEAKDILKKTQDYFENHLGIQTQKYPPYSSKTVDGVQLHEHARAGTEVELPEHDVSLQAFEDLSLEEVESSDILMRVGELTAGVTGDFRQKEIVEAWADLALPEKLPLLLVTLEVSSGFYIRQLAQDLGKALGTGACLYSLVRTQVGEYTKAEN
jgi:tRNA pseudouridine55 synthase